MSEHRVGDKPRALCIDMTVAGSALAMREEALRNHEVQMILRPRHGNVQQPPLFLDLGR